MINAERLASTSPEEIAAEMIRVRREIDERELYWSRLAVAFDASLYWNDEGSNTAIDWMRINCHMTQPAAANRVAVGSQLSRMPESAQAVSAGEIGFAHVTVMARTAIAVGAAFNETALLDKARKLSPGKFYYRCQQYQHSVQPEVYANEQAEQAQKNKLRLNTAEDGSLLISGVLDSVN